MASNLVRLSPSFSCFPVMHGKAIFSLELRNILWNNNFDCIVIAFPERLKDELINNVEKLPYIHALCLHIDGTTAAYVPTDPCDAYIEGIRQARQRKIPLKLVEDDTILYHQEFLSFPDSYLIKSIGIKKYYETCAEYLREIADDAILRHRAYITLKEIQQIRKSFRRILYICDFPLLVAIDELSGTIDQKISFLENNLSDNELERTTSSQLIQLFSYPIVTNHLYFALGELPFYTGELEKERMSPIAIPTDYTKLIKKIFIETRKNYLSKHNETEQISLSKLQIALRYLRNLSVSEGNLIPGLFDLITAAKGVFGPHFAAKLLEAAKYYPFFNLSPKQENIRVSLDKIQTPLDAEPVESFNLLQDESKEWRTIHLKKEPDPDKQRDYKYLWDPRGMCSHIPEDMKIEGFNQSIRRRSHQIMSESFSRSEKFTSSTKDGIDIQMTLRNWHTGDIYVKEIPPVDKNVDTVVIIFDQDNDEQYPLRSTWYAEHEEESTLTFFSTDPFKTMVGPGIAKAEYGGLSLLFPPKPIENVFIKYPASNFQNLTEQLTFGALINSQEKQISFISSHRPGIRLRKIASMQKKKLIWIPLKSFSQETLRKLKRFHILNGKNVRNWVSRYIIE